MTFYLGHWELKLWNIYSEIINFLWTLRKKTSSKENSYDLNVKKSCKIFKINGLILLDCRFWKVFGIVCTQKWRYKNHKCTESYYRTGGLKSSLQEIWTASQNLHFQCCIIGNAMKKMKKLWNGTLG